MFSWWYLFVLKYWFDYILILIMIIAVSFSETASCSQTQRAPSASMRVKVDPELGLTVSPAEQICNTLHMVNDLVWRAYEALLAFGPADNFRFTITVTLSFRCIWNSRLYQGLKKKLLDTLLRTRPVNEKDILMVSGWARTYTEVWGLCPHWGPGLWGPGVHWGLESIGLWSPLGSGLWRLRPRSRTFSTSQ